MAGGVPPPFALPIPVNLALACIDQCYSPGMGGASFARFRDTLPARRGPTLVRVDRRLWSGEANAISAFDGDQHARALDSVDTPCRDADGSAGICPGASPEGS